jgi:hypothetical protein
MLPANHYTIRRAGPDDDAALRRLAALDSRPVPRGRVLIGELRGAPAAALSLEDGRVVANPFERTAQLVAAMRLRGGVARRYEAAPSLRRRLALGLAPTA